MSQENVDIVRRCTEALDRREFTKVFEMLDPDVEIDLSRNVFNPDVYRGHSGVERWRDGIDEVGRLPREARRTHRRGGRRGHRGDDPRKREGERRRRADAGLSSLDAS